MIILLLGGCTAGPAKISPAEEMALAIRGEYLEASTWTAEVELTADYGQRVYQYTLTASDDGTQTLLTLTAPETVAGITARLEEEKGVLEYDGMIVETGPLDDQGLTPVSALPVLMETVRSGYISTCNLEEEQLRVSYCDPEEEPGVGREVVLWFDGQTHALLRGEINVDGVRVIESQFLNFTKG